MDKKVFGKRLNKIRNEKKLTAEQLAEKADISVYFVREIEGGRKLPSMPVLISLINALDVPADVLLRDFVNKADTAVLNDLTKKLVGLPPEQLKMITDVVDSMLTNIKSGE